MADFELVVVEDWVFFIDVAVGDEICELQKLVQIEVQEAEVVTEEICARLFDVLGSFL